jgi:hypothetical protein
LSPIIRIVVSGSRPRNKPPHDKCSPNLNGGPTEENGRALGFPVDRRVGKRASPRHWAYSSRQ